MLILTVASYVAIWAAYGFRHAPASATTGQVNFVSLPLATERAPGLTGIINWVDGHRLLPNAYAQGFLLGQAKAQKRSAYLAGEFSIEGWWYYFPFAFLIKTPVVVILLFVIGVVLCFARAKTLLETDVFVLAPVAVFLGAPMAAHLNIGLRHVLPIFPFALLLAGKCATWAKIHQRGWLWIPLAAVMLLEFVFHAWPDYLAFFNFVVGGPRHGGEYLVDSNLDWGQDLKGLKRWMDRHHVEHINLSYFGTADPDYYGIKCTYLPGCPFFADHLVARPQLPGYVAVSVTNLRGVYFNEQWREFYRPLLESRPVDRIGNSIFIYRRETEWWR